MPNAEDLEYCTKKREECISRSKTLGFLDAVFAIYHFNLRERSYCNHILEIAACEVFEHYDQAAYDTTLARATALCREDFSDSDRYGEFEDRFSSLMVRNPGFNKQTYLVAYNDWQYAVSR